MEVPRLWGAPSMTHAWSRPGHRPAKPRVWGHPAAGSLLSGTEEATAGQGLLAPPLLHTASRDRPLTPQPPSVGAPHGFGRGTECEGSLREAEASTGSRTSHVYKRPEAARPASTNAMMARLRPAAGIPKLGAGRRGLGVFAGETC